MPYQEKADTPQPLPEIIYAPYNPPQLMDISVNQDLLPDLLSVISAGRQPRFKQIIISGGMEFQTKKQGEMHLPLSAHNPQQIDLIVDLIFLNKQILLEAGYFMKDTRQISYFPDTIAWQVIYDSYSGKNYPLSLESFSTQAQNYQNDNLLHELEHGFQRKKDYLRPKYLLRNELTLNTAIATGFLAERFLIRTLENKIGTPISTLNSLEFASQVGMLVSFLNCISRSRQYAHDPELGHRKRLPEMAIEDKIFAPEVRNLCARTFQVRTLIDQAELDEFFDCISDRVSHWVFRIS